MLTYSRTAVAGERRQAFSFIVHLHSSADAAVRSAVAGACAPAPLPCDQRDELFSDSFSRPGLFDKRNLARGSEGEAVGHESATLYGLH